MVEKHHPSKASDFFAGSHLCRAPFWKFRGPKRRFEDKAAWGVVCTDKLPPSITKVRCTWRSLLGEHLVADTQAQSCLRGHVTAACVQGASSVGKVAA